MIRSTKSLWFFGAALLLTLGLQEGRAAACTYACQQVSPNCRRCIDTGTITNQTCKNSGSCNCIYTNECFGLAAAAVTPDMLKDAIFAQPEAQPAVPSFDFASLAVAQ